MRIETSILQFLGCIFESSYAPFFNISENRTRMQDLGIYEGRTQKQDAFLRKDMNYFCIC